MDPGKKYPGNFQRTGRKGLDYQRMGRKGLDFQGMGKKRLDFQRMGRKGLDFQRMGKKGLNFQSTGKKGLDFQSTGKKGLDFQTTVKKGLDYRRMVNGDYPDGADYGKWLNSSRFLFVLYIIFKMTSRFIFQHDQEKLHLLMAEQNITPLDRIGYQFIINKD